MDGFDRDTIKLL